MYVSCHEHVIFMGTENRLLLFLLLYYFLNPLLPPLLSTPLAVVNTIKIVAPAGISSSRCIVSISLIPVVVVFLIMYRMISLSSHINL